MVVSGSWRYNPSASYSHARLVSITFLVWVQRLDLHCQNMQSSVWFWYFCCKYVPTSRPSESWVLVQETTRPKSFTPLSSELKATTKETQNKTISKGKVRDLDIKLCCPALTAQELTSFCATTSLAVTSQGLIEISTSVPSCLASWMSSFSMVTVWVTQIIMPSYYVVSRYRKNAIERVLNKLQ